MKLIEYGTKMGKGILVIPKGREGWFCEEFVEDVSSSSFVPANEDRALKGGLLIVLSMSSKQTLPLFIEILLVSSKRTLPLIIKILSFTVILLISRPCCGLCMATLVICKKLTPMIRGERSEKVVCNSKVALPHRREWLCLVF